MPRYGARRTLWRLRPQLPGFSSNTSGKGVPQSGPRRPSRISCQSRLIGDPPKACHQVLALDVGWSNLS
jgi:hypothetical protein